ncbi:Aste57867_23205 [Aphanomyces stellatus]|uniref:Aste57867_23205 protein n=1 Tax=Aphanomyces stellatus TaxID=120398 RepID=A0A485LM93_9STRA|nr:hypothetical protein As57867_023134 [Aphanomyces stellatus]VFT99852.1 Aste57867_23205 [Aphanomyces stellatus]
MASEPAWTCVASSAFPLVYGYSKELTLGGRSSRALEKDHAKLIQALEQQLKIKGRSLSSKAETLFFYSHFPFVTPQELELVLMRLSEQFVTTNQLSFRLAILEMFLRLKVHFPLKAIPDASKIVVPIAQLVTQLDDIESRIVAFQVLAALAPYIRDDATIHQAILSKLAAATPPAEAAAAVDTAKELVPHSPSFQRTLSLHVLTAVPLHPNLLPLLHLGVPSSDVAKEQWTKCQDFLRRGIYAEHGVVEYVSPRWLAPCLMAMTRLSLLITPNGIAQQMEFLRSLVTPGSVTATLQRIIIACLMALAQLSEDMHEDVLRWAETTVQPSESEDVDSDLLALVELVSRRASLSADAAAFSLALFERQPRRANIYAHILFNQARHDIARDGHVASLQQLFHLLAAAPALHATTIRLLEGLATAFPLLVPPLLAPRLCASLLDRSIAPTPALWVFLSHLAALSPLDAAHASALAHELKTATEASTTMEAIFVALLRSGEQPQAPPAALTDQWLAYRLARECLVHGVFAQASTLLHPLHDACASERTAFWILGLQHWAAAEAPLLDDTSAPPTMVPGATLANLPAAIASIQAAASSAAPLAFPLAFLHARLTFFTTLQGLFQHVLETQITGQHASERRLVDAAAQLAQLGRTFTTLGNAAWGLADLDTLAAHGHLCDLLAYAVTRIGLRQAGVPAWPLPWPGAVSPDRYMYPLWRLCCALDQQLPAAIAETPSSIQLLGDLLQTAINVPCATPRQFFRTAPATVAADVQLASPALKMMSRSVLGIASQTDCQGHLQVALQLQDVRAASPFREVAASRSSSAWRLQFDGLLAADGATTGFHFESSVDLDPSSFNVGGQDVWYGALPLRLDAIGFGAQGTSCVLSGSLWLVDKGAARWPVALKALERTIVVY